MLERVHQNILKTIEQCSYNFYIVQQDFNIDCVCTEHATKQADPNCKLCLSTGKKITIRKIRGACNEIIEGGLRSSTNPSAAPLIRNYFIPAKYPIYQENLIIDDNEVGIVFRNTKLKGIKGELCHQECLVTKKQNDQEKVLKNFKEIIKKYSK